MSDPIFNTDKMAIIMEENIFLHQEIRVYREFFKEMKEVINNVRSASDEALLKIDCLNRGFLDKRQKIDEKWREV